MNCSLQETQLYYDPKERTYYEYDTVTDMYQVHSKVKLPKAKHSRSKWKTEKDRTEPVIDLCSSSSASEEEGNACVYTCMCTYCTCTKVCHLCIIMYMHIYMYMYIYVCAYALRRPLEYTLWVYEP